MQQRLTASGGSRQCALAPVRPGRRGESGPKKRVGFLGSRHQRVYARLNAPRLYGGDKAAGSPTPALRGRTQGGPSDSKPYDAMQQVRISETVMQRGRREFLAFRNLGIGIGFEEICNAVGGEAKINAGISIELQRPIDALGGALDAGAQL